MIDVVVSFVVLESTYAVFDPLGGLAVADRVTGAACDAFRLGVETHGDVTRALEGANESVRATVGGDATLRGAGCTAAASSLRPGLATIAWAGDVHVLLLRAGGLCSITREHSMLNDNAAGFDMWTLSPSQRKTLGSVIVRGLGMMRELVVEVRTSSIEPGDVFAMLSDGLLDALGEGLLLSLLQKHRTDLDAGVRALLDAGKANGGKGALTVVLVAGASVSARSDVA